MSSVKVIFMLAMATSTLAVPVDTQPDRSSSFGTKFPLESSSNLKSWEEPTVPRDYMFNYDIQDGLVGMTHSRGEVQKNGVIRGFYRYSRPDGVLVSVSYTADETGFHPVITEEAVPSLRSASSVHSIYSSDHPEQIKVTITEEDVQLARQKSEAYAASVAATARAPTAGLNSLKQQFRTTNTGPSKLRSAQQIFADSFESEQFAAESQDSEHVLYSAIPESARYPKTASLAHTDGLTKRYYTDLAGQ